MVDNPKTCENSCLFVCLLFLHGFGGKLHQHAINGAYPPKKSEPSHVSLSKESDGTHGLKNQAPVSGTRGWVLIF